MSHCYRFIIGIIIFLITAQAYAVDFFVDALYWRATEIIDWCYDNNLNSTNQNINYQTLDFHYSPGFKLGIGNSGYWDTGIYYTFYYSSTTAAASGNLVSSFLAGKLSQGSNFFYKTGQARARINFNMLDFDFGKKYFPSKTITFKPIVGLRGGWIYQKIDTSFQGTKNINEFVRNNFSGAGIKGALETNWALKQQQNHGINIFADFTTSYMWGNWDISDMLYENGVSSIETSVGSRNFGAFTIQGFMGIRLDYKHLKFKLGYEIDDWFNQYQVLDDGTGAHNNDLILQGLTLQVIYAF